MVDETVDQLVESIPKSMSDLEDMPLYSILLFLGACLSIGVGLLLFLFFLSFTFSTSSFIDLIINIILGTVILLVASNMLEMDSQTTSYLMLAIVVLISSITIIFLGGIVGRISGFIALIGSVIALANHLYKPLNL